MAGVLQPDDQRSVHEHLRELRGRLLWWVVFLVIFGGIALYFQRPLSAIVVAPLKSKLYYTSPLGGVDFLFKIVLVFGLIPSFPVLIYQILRFVEPALPQKLGKILPKMIFSSIALTIGSIIFSYSPAGLPLIFKFLHVFDSPEVQPLINAQEYFSFVMWYLVLIDIFIQLPLVLVVINHITPISLKKLNKYQFYILVGLFLLAGLITPGIDPRPQLVLFVPMALVFELAVFSIYLTNRKRDVVSPKLIDLEARADQFYQAGNTKAARNLYAEICVNKDAAAKSHARMGIICINDKNFVQARTELEKAITINDSVASYHANLGMALIGLELPSEALESLEKAIGLAPDNPKYRQLRALATEMKQNNIRFWQ